MHKLIGLVTLQSLLLVMTQVFLKASLMVIGKFEWSWHFIKVLLSTWQLALCGVFGISTMILYIYILKNYDFSLAYPLTCISYVFGLLAALFIFHESIPLTRWIGVFIIVIGVFLVLK